MKRTKWFERKFPLQDDNGILPCIIERLEGTSVRISELVNKLSDGHLSKQQGERWSVKQNIGHLNDLEPLWLTRVIEISAGDPELTAADLSNEKTHKAAHNSKNVNNLIEQFRASRNNLVEKLRNLNDAELDNSSMHPRLKTPMKIIDLAYFVAEHDDHHLADIREVIKWSGD